MTPELSYSLAGYRPGDYRDAAEWILDLKNLGFRCITFTPTYLVHDEVPMRIEPERGPAFDELARAVAFASEAGLHVQIDPHLDWESTLTGGPYEWRRRMYFNPAEAYFDQILAPTVAVMNAAGAENCTLTLGSELDVSLVEFAPQWRTVADAIRGLSPRLTLTHKLNGDSLDRGESIRTDLNRERARRSLPEVRRNHYVQLVDELSEYLSALDTVSFSFYPQVPKNSNMSSVFTQSANALESKLRASAGSRPHLSIGEFGLGSIDTMRPWEFEEKTFLGPDGKMTDDAREIRRRYYQGLLDALGSNLRQVQRASFWTVAQYDFLGVTGNEVFRDDVLRDAVRAYNQQGT